MSLVNRLPGRSALLFLIPLLVFGGLAPGEALPAGVPATEDGGPGMIPLDRCAVVLGEEPAYVRPGAEDLCSYLEEITGARPRLCSSLPEAREADVVILVGQTVGTEVAAGSEPQGYVLQIKPGKPTRILAAGNDPQGTKFALVDLLSAIRREGTLIGLPADLNVRAKPCFALRGMYAHLHWQYDNPYALRSWSLEDWKRYIDLLTYMKVNLFQIWTMAAICPNPLSAGDEAYLRKYHEVVKYAREMRGMEVWPGECANNIAKSDFGAPIERREYFQVESLQNPADPQQFQAIMDSRANLYRLINNGDGYWIIDSDPGGWEGSPAGELADIFAGNRALIDRHAALGRKAKLVYWMWSGWGKGTEEENWRGTIAGIRDKVPEPWWLTPCNESHLQTVAAMGYLGKSVFFPYNAIESEPSNPFTKIRFTPLSERFALALKYPGLHGIMGNAQTPLAQLPNIFYLAEARWDPANTRRTDEEVLRRLARFLFPEIEEELADAWLSLSVPDAGRAFASSRTLEQLVSQGKTGRPGPGGRFVFPEPTLVVKDLVLMLKIHGAAEQIVAAVQAGAGADAIQDTVFGYLSRVLEWQARTGFHGCRVEGVDFRGGGSLLWGLDSQPVQNSLEGYFAQPGNEAQKELWSRSIGQRLKSAGFSATMAELRGTRMHCPTVVTWPWETVPMAR